MQKNQCAVNYTDMTLSSGGGSVPLLKAPSINNSCDVFLIDSLSLPPLTEVDVPCKVACNNLICDGEQLCHVVLERRDCLLEKYEVTTATCVQTVRGKNVCVRFANFTNEQKVLPAGTNVARLVPLVGSGNICYVNAYSMATDNESVVEPHFQSVAEKLIEMLKM